MGNPLQQYFRQPKIYIKLPSGGLFSKTGTFQGDLTRMPIYGMTGMDEIILKTPDALLSGESTARVIESCCSSINDAWEISTLDTNAILAAIRIATFGPTLSIKHVCSKCQTENEYDIDLNKIMEFYGNCKYDNKIVLDQMTIKLQPLTYRLSNEYSLKNFNLQQRLRQTEAITDRDQQQQMINALFKELGEMQNEIYLASVEAIELRDAVVTERQYINEFLRNCDSEIFDAIKKKNEQNRDTWAMPLFPVTCGNCAAEVNLSVDLDESSFFARA